MPTRYTKISKKQCKTCKRKPDESFSKPWRHRWQNWPPQAALHQRRRTGHPDIQESLHQWFVINRRRLATSTFGPADAPSCHNAEHTPKIENGPLQISIRTAEWTQIRLERPRYGATRDTGSDLRGRDCKNIMGTKGPAFMVLRPFI